MTETYWETFSFKIYYSYSSTEITSNTFGDACVVYSWQAELKVSLLLQSKVYVSFCKTLRPDY